MKKSSMKTKKKEGKTKVEFSFFQIPLMHRRVVLNYIIFKAFHLKWVLFYPL